jgi:hypothetical protein
VKVARPVQRWGKAGNTRNVRLTYTYEGLEFYNNDGVVTEKLSYLMSRQYGDKTRDIFEYEGVSFQVSVAYVSEVPVDEVDTIPVLLSINCSTDTVTQNITPEQIENILDKFKALYGEPTFSQILPAGSTIHWTDSNYKIKFYHTRHLMAISIGMLFYIG